MGARGDRLWKYRNLEIGVLLIMLFCTAGITQCPADSDGDGWSVEGGDCQDNDPAVYPNAVEICDLKDNNCDGRVDELRLFYVDRDEDGFGVQAESVLHCTAPKGYSEALGDCRDDDDQVYPGAEDSDGDGVDQDCGGSDGPQPSVGLDDSKCQSVQEALDTMKEGDTVWVGSGAHFASTLNFGGRAGTLASTYGADLTQLDAGGLGPVLRFDSGEGPDTVVRGFTIRNGTTGIYVSGASPTFEDLYVRQNASEGRGGGVWLEYASPTFHNCVIASNRSYYAEGAGGGIYMIGSNPTLTNCAILGNEAYRGGGLYSENSSPTIVNCLFLGNESIFGMGGGVFMKGAAGVPELRNTLVADNAPDNLYVDPAEPAAPVLVHNNFFNPTGTNHNLETLPATNSSVDPDFVRYSNDWNIQNDDYHLAPDSPLIDAGDSALCDPDGSRSDIGCYGGPVAEEWAYYDDSDGDGMYAGWERQYMLKASEPDAQEDRDGDKLLNADEFRAHTDPQEPDSDQDGWTDREEIDRGSDPLNWYSQPGAGMVEARVPDDFTSVQAAIDALVYEGAIRVAPGIYEEHLEIRNKKKVSIGGEGGAESTVIDAQSLESPVILGTSSHIDLQGLTLQNGKVSDPSFTSGGAALAWVDGTLRDIEVVGNDSLYSGGGLFLLYADIVLQDSRIASNVAGTHGGGVVAYRSSLEVDHCTIADNSSDQNGGGLFSDGSTVRILGSDFYGNESVNGGSAGMGGGAYFLGSDLDIAYSSLHDNNLGGTGDGGALYLEGTVATLYNVRLLSNTTDAGSGGAVAAIGGALTVEYVELADNRGGADGGAVYLEDGEFSMAHCILHENAAHGWGGALAVSRGADLTMNHCIVVGNFATMLQGGGIYADDSTGSAMLTLRNSILAYNLVTNLYSPSGVSQDIDYSDLYGPVNYYRSFPRMLSTVLNVDPDFQEYGPEGLPLDFHLSSSSPLVGAGSPDTRDPDASLTDMGAYGGPGGAGWDLDGDGYPNYFWPGAFENVPAGVDPAVYDCDDLDPYIHSFDHRDVPPTR